MPRARAALDGRGVEPIHPQRMAQHLQKADFGGVHFLIGGGHVAGEGVGGLEEMRRQRLAHQRHERIQPVLALEMAQRQIRQRREPGAVIALEGGQKPHDGLNLAPFALAHLAAGGRGHEHHGDQRVLRRHRIAGQWHGDPLF